MEQMEPFILKTQLSRNFDNNFQFATRHPSKHNQMAFGTNGSNGQDENVRDNRFGASSNRLLMIYSQLIDCNEFLHLLEFSEKNRETAMQAMQPKPKMTQRDEQ